VLGGWLYAAGGLGGYRSKSIVERYVASDTWTTVAGMLECRGDFCAVTIEAIWPA
jgi:hypothetical protein